MTAVDPHRGLAAGYTPACEFPPEQPLVNGGAAQFVHWFVRTCPMCWVKAIAQTHYDGGNWTVTVVVEGQRTRRVVTMRQWLDEFQQTASLT